MPPRSAGIQQRSVQELTIQKPKRPDAGSTQRRTKRTCVQGVGSTLYNPVSAPLAAIQLPNMLCPYFNSLEWKHRPQYSQLWQADCSIPNIDSTFGLVPKGSVLSYQQACVATDSGNVVVCETALTPDPFIFPDFSYIVADRIAGLTEDLLRKFSGLIVSVNQAAEYEMATRQQSNSNEWHKLRMDRITASQFKRICSRKSDFEKLAASLRQKKFIQTSAMKFGLENEPVAANVYARTFAKNVFTVGFVINPSVCFLGCSPDRLVYDGECEEWGLLEIKCPQAKTVADLKYLKSRSVDGLHLNKTHEYYYQVMGQMGLSGREWCDFFVYAASDYHLERIYFDKKIFEEKILQKLVAFFFTYYIHYL